APRDRAGPAQRRADGDPGPKQDAGVGGGVAVVEESLAAGVLLLHELEVGRVVDEQDLLVGRRLGALAAERPVEEAELGQQLARARVAVPGVAHAREASTVVPLVVEEEQRGGHPSVSLMASA